MQDRAVIVPTVRLARHAGPEAHRCDLCGAPVLEIKCKIVCKNCGYTRDCSDP